MTARHASPLRRAARHPVAHFVALGAALLAVERAWWSAGGAVPATAIAAARQPIVMPRAHVHRLETGFRQRWGRPPGDAERRALIERAVEEEILYREARRLALDFDDASVRRRLLDKARAVSLRPGASAAELVEDARALGFDDDLVIRRLLAEKMRLVLEAEGPAAPISDAEIREYLERHREQFTEPGTVTFTHVFLSEARGDRLRADAEVVSRALGAGPPSAAAERLSDAFPFGSRVSAYRRGQVIGRFGAAFADAVFALRPGGWSPPLESPYGLHLVWVHERRPERTAPLEAVRARITLALHKEQAARNLAGGVALLRGLYPVHIEDADGPPPGHQ